MKKEVSIAVIIGVILGAVILYGINIANQATSNLSTSTDHPQVLTPTPSTASNTTPTPTITDNPISITSHANNQLVFEKDIDISGQTTPNSKIAIIWEDDEIITNSDAKGIFSQRISLVPGENSIQLSLLKSDKTLITLPYKIYYSSKTLE